MTDDPLLRKCCDTCNHFWVDAPTRYSQCRKIDAQIDGEDIAFIVKIGCASHSSFTYDIPSSKELNSLAEHDWHNREERKHKHPMSPWVSGWITGFLSERKPNWGKEREEKVRNETLDEIPVIIRSDKDCIIRHNGFDYIRLIDVDVAVESLRGEP